MAARKGNDLFLFCLLHGISRGKSSEKYVLVVSVSFFLSFAFAFLVFSFVAMCFLLFFITYNIYENILHAENFFALYAECIQIGQKVVRTGETQKIN